MADAVRANNTNKAGNLIGDPRDVFIALGVVMVVIMIVIPLPTVLLDTFMALNLVLSLLILLIVLYTQKATDFSLFPTVLLVVTVFGLALNICSTRLILSKGAAFDGRMIRAFSSFVVGSGGTEGLVVGFIIFIVIIAVQVVVITKGASRVSEVAARFTLDALPGKQMAIEAELNSQAITEEEARLRKQELQQEVDFYGAMDGASKFISGNVKIGIFITVLNALGGIIIGAIFHGEPLSQAVGTYMSFTIGDGLLSQFPALLVSTAMGIVVTRSASPGSIGEAVSTQFTRDARIYWICAVVLFGFALLPGFPWYVLIPMGIIIAFYAYRIGQKQRKKAYFDEMMAKSADTKKPKDDNGEMSPVVPLDPLSLELGYGLIPLVDKDKGAELLERVQGIRRQSALELGLVIPKIRIIDNMLLEPSEYCFKIRGVDAGRGKIRMGYYLCMNPGTVREELPGEKTRDPAFGLPAVWISEDKRDEAERAGYTVVDPPSIIATHLTEIIKTHASEILGRQETQAILDTLRKEYPALVEEAQSQKALSLGDIQKVLQGLLKEQVSIRNMVTILEALADFAPLTRDVRFLTEKARQALGRQICHRYADEERVLHVLTIDPSLEQKIIESRVETSSGGIMSALDPAVQNAWIKSLARSVAVIQEHGWFPIIVCSESARYLVKVSSERELPELAVLSVPEIVADVTLEAVGVIRLDH
ncbi:MAG: flagellar biosynthesis protein FlhA [Treponema sp.]|jgi:flagellar biosynthesis protein FlhA|nr:flagellar biosynthesis protein FlhA [Treponema sp.]